MHLNTYLLFAGDCEAAFKFYERCLNGKIVTLMKHGESPMGDQASPEWRDKVMHVSLQIGDQLLMGSDAPPKMYQKPQGFSVSVTLSSPADSERTFAALSENGSITMPLQKTFWSPAFGMFVDQYGTPWMVNTDGAP